MYRNRRMMHARPTRRGVVMWRRHSPRISLVFQTATFEPTFKREAERYLTVHRSYARRYVATGALPNTPFYKALNSCIRKYIDYALFE